MADLGLNMHIGKYVLCILPWLFNFDEIDEADKQYNLLDTIFDYTVIFAYFVFFNLAGGMFQSYPPAKLQISQKGISRQESFLSQSAPRESSGRTDHTNLRHSSVRVFLVGKIFGFGMVEKCHKCEIYHFEILYLAGDIFLMPCEIKNS